MWYLIGVDKDGKRHRWNDCQTEQEAKVLLEGAMPSLMKMREPYKEVLAQALEDEKEGRNEGLYYSDYMGWKMQGFYVDHFIIEERGE